MRYKVPQNIDMEDKIIGPLTMIQFVYAVIGGGFCYTILMKIPAPFSYVLVIPAALLTFAIIFLKINERSFLQFMGSVFQFVSAPKQRVWQHQNSDLNIEIYQAQQKTGPVVQTKQFTPEDIRNFAKQLDGRQFK